MINFEDEYAELWLEIVKKSDKSYQHQDISVGEIYLDDESIIRLIQGKKMGRYFYCSFILFGKKYDKDAPINVKERILDVMKKELKK